MGCILGEDGFDICLLPLRRATASPIWSMLIDARELGREEPRRPEEEGPEEVPRLGDDALVLALVGVSAE